MKKCKIEAIKTAREIIGLKPVYLDTETTGLDSEAEIVDIAIINHDGTEFINTLVRPVSPIPPAATRIHGITNEGVAAAPKFGDIVLDLHIDSDQIAVIYNRDYDLRVIKQSAEANGVDWIPPENAICAMELYAQFYGDWNERYKSYRWQKQSVAAKRLGIEIPADLHRAAADAQLCRLIVEAMAATPLSGEEEIPCKLCGEPTKKIGTKMCDRCFELKGRIEADPELSLKILAEFVEKQKARRTKQESPVLPNFDPTGIAQWDPDEGNWPETD